eukprot:TRINITY_DN85177_c0_g1_i1.p1 TRINITY_DN85177_c0_g1~~TRINITY_DN85177_c0_g1_i1.p1  ORF type:complete len:473 (-),score=15.84 TRINITY_DN85177_c0_g1_i1:134-1552(-)
MGRFYVGLLRCELTDKVSGKTASGAVVSAQDVRDRQLKLSHRKQQLTGRSIEDDVLDVKISVRLSNEVQWTSICKGRKEFAWEDTLVFDVQDISVAEFTVWHQDRCWANPEILGKTWCPCTELVRGRTENYIMELEELPYTSKKASLSFRLYTFDLGVAPVDLPTVYFDFKDDCCAIRPISENQTFAHIDTLKLDNPVALLPPTSVGPGEEGQIISVQPAVSDQFPSCKFVIRSAHVLRGEDPPPDQNTNMPSITFGVVFGDFSPKRSLTEQGYCITLPRCPVIALGESVGVSNQYLSPPSPIADGDSFTVLVTDKNTLAFEKNGHRLVFDYHGSWSSGARPLRHDGRPMLFAVELSSPDFCVQFERKYMHKVIAKGTPKEEKPLVSHLDISQTLVEEKDIRLMWERYDIDGSGFMSKNEALQLLKASEEYFGLASMHSDRIMRSALAGNTFKDDTLSYEEFHILILQLARR